MNHIHRFVFSRRSGKLVAVAETVAGQGKAASRQVTVSSGSRALLALAMGFSLAPTGAWADAVSATGIGNVYGAGAADPGIGTNVGNTAYGINAGGTVDGDYNAGNGAYSTNDVTGNFNTGSGAFSSQNVTGSDNTGSGSSASTNITGSGNTGSGYGASSNIIGDNNTGSGYFSSTSVTGSNNTGSGANSGQYVQGNYNTAAGANSGQNVNGNNNVAVGAGAGSGTAITPLAASNTTALGANAQAIHDNSVALGANSVTSVGAQAGYTGAYVGASSSTGEVAVGGRQITGVAAGSVGTDAVNVNQLNAGVGSAVTQANSYTDSKITGVAGAVNQLDNRVTTLDNRVTSVEGNITDLDQRVTRVQNGADGMFQVSPDRSGQAPGAGASADIASGVGGVGGAGALASGASNKPRPTGMNSVAGGAGAVAGGNNALALGNDSRATANNSTALGTGATASHANSVAVGTGSATTVGAQAGYNAAYVGKSSSSGEANFGGRTLTGVAPGAAGTDAANINQLNSGVNQAIGQANNYTDQQLGSLRGEMGDLRREAFRGIAQAAALVPLAPSGVGETTLNLGLASYGGEAAGGVAVAHQLNERINLNGGVGFSSGGRALVRVGVGMRF